MAFKITIRRVGAKLPAVCLVVILFFCALLFWLSVIGLPRCVIERLEESAAGEGIHVSIGGVYLEPFQGICLSARDVRLYATANKEETPIAEIDSFTGSVHISSIFAGDVIPKVLKLEKGQIRIPLKEREDAHAELTDIHVECRVNRRKRLRFTSASLRLQGMPVRLMGIIDLSEYIEPETTATESAPTETAAKDLLPPYLEQIQPYAVILYDQVKSQQWQKNEIPSISFGLDTTPGAFKAQLKLNLHRYDYKDVKLRDISATLQFYNKALLIKNVNFKTVDPDAEVHFRGGYALDRRELSFSIKSTAHLKQALAAAFEDEVAQEWLRRIDYAQTDSPDIALLGDVAFDENYKLVHATVHGELSQNRLRIDNTLYNRLELSFYYDDGNFAIDKLQCELDDGSITLTASALDGQGEATLLSNLPTDRIIAILSPFCGDEPLMPAALAIEGPLQLEVKARLTAPIITPDQSAWQDYVPSLQSVFVGASCDKVSYQGHECTEPVLELSLNGISANKDLIPVAADSVHVTASAKEHRMSGEDDDNPLSVLSPYLDLKLASVKIDETLELESFCLAGVDLLVKTESVQVGDLTLTGIQLQSRDLDNLYPLRDDFSLTKGGLNIKVREFLLSDSQLGSATLDLALMDSDTALLSFTIQPADGKKPLELTTQVNRKDDHIWQLQETSLQLPAGEFAKTLADLDISFKEFRIPDELTLTGSASFDTDKMQLARADIHADIPTFIRTPYKISAFRGDEVPVHVTADAVLSSAPDGNILFNGNARIAHETGTTKVRFSGESDRGVRVTGTNDMRVDIVDRLIDSETAHSIMRDFLANSKSVTKAHNICVDVEYHNGLTVIVDCDAELHNLAYQMSVLEDKEDGTEILNPELKDYPRPLVTSGFCHVHVDVAYDCKKPDGKLKKDVCCITLSDITMHYDNTPWLRYKKIKGGTRNSTLKGDKVIIDVENSFVELVNVKGTAYPAYSLGMFYGDLHEFLADVELPRPPQLETHSCVFPIYSDCVRPMSGTLFARSDRGARFHFLGTEIPLDKFTGYIYLTDDFVQLQDMNAKTWDGVVNATIKIGISGDHTSFDGYVTAANLNLKDIAAAYGAKLEPALCNADIRFRSPTPEVKDIEGYGTLSITDGNLMKTGLFQPVSELITDLPDYLLFFQDSAEKKGAGVVGDLPDEVDEKPSHISRFSRWLDRKAGYIPFMNHLLAYGIQDAHARYEIRNGHLTTTSLKAEGSNLNVACELDINLDTLALRGKLWPRITSLPTLLISPFTFLSDFIIDVNIYGNVSDIKWKFSLDKRLKASPTSFSE